MIIENSITVFDQQFWAYGKCKKRLTYMLKALQGFDRLNNTYFIIYNYVCITDKRVVKM